MPIADIRSDLDSRILLNAAISTDTTTVGAILDTANFDLGVMLSVLCTAYTDGTYTLLLEESDDSGMAGATTVTTEQLIGSLPALSALTANNVQAETVGFFSTKRYIRVSIVSTATTTGASILVHAASKAELVAVTPVGNTGVLA